MQLDIIIAITALTWTVSVAATFIMLHRASRHAPILVDSRELSDLRVRAERARELAERVAL